MMRRLLERFRRVLQRRCPDCGVLLSDSGLDYVSSLEIHECGGGW